MHRLSLLAVLGILVSTLSTSLADQNLLKTHCGKCHRGEKPKGDFDLRLLGDAVDARNRDYWLNSLDYVKSGEMPPAKQSRLLPADRRRLVDYFLEQLKRHDSRAVKPGHRVPRRLNNRELARSVADVLRIEDVGTHQPLANLLGDTLHDGFDTNGDALGLSEFHLEQYINAFRQVIDATVLSGERPATRRITVRSKDLRLSDRSNRKRAENANRTDTSIEILDLRNHVYFDNFKTVPATGRYRMTIRATGVDRNVYDAKATGHYRDDPIRLRVHLGDRVRDFDLPDNEVAELKLDEWLAAGTQVRITYLTDALRLVGNGNFKFQYRIARDYLKKHKPQLYQKVVTEEVPKARRRSNQPDHWIHWTGYWQGPRPRLFGAEIEGPIYESWPPRRQTALLGVEPTAAKAEAILRPIAERAWRRNLEKGELDSIVRLVQTRGRMVGDVEALKEGLVAVLASPSFLLINPERGEAADRFATKLSFFLQSTTPSDRLRAAVRGSKLDSFATVRGELRNQLASGAADEFLREFPRAWLQLDRINFMAPDPDRYPLYHRKAISDDMVDEVLAFFRHAVVHNIPIPELLTADYSFVNADLAKVYKLPSVAPDSKLRKYTFADGRRGGLLGMGAFLTLTADSLGTSPIHRAVYVMENFLGIHPTPPPADVNIAEPDVRQAKTIKEILNAHRSDTRCASCHQSIDPYGYAFENFDPVGSWRDQYTAHLAPPTANRDRRRNEPAAKGIAVDASATFRNGTGYDDIRGFRKLMESPANRDRFVRCFIVKLLTYANGEEPVDFTAVEKIVARAAEHEYRIVDTIAAVIHSPLFRDH